MKRIVIFAVLILSVLCGCAKNGEQEMTLEEKVAQMIMVRCRDDMTPLLDEGVGGIVMFARDFQGLTKEEVQAKTSQYLKKSKIQPFIATDEEGGTVVRVSSNPYLRQSPFESPAYYYRSGGMDSLINITAEKCALLKDLGLNMNLGPVADVSTDPDDFIYKRSLGENEETTAQYVAEAVKAAKRQGIASCLKHFPGYGSNADTHTGSAIDNRDIETFRNKDFLPFVAGISEQAEAVLISHNTMVCMDDQNPASISYAVHDILRNELGFEGIIITDDMDMDAVKEYDNVYIKAVNAGNDMIMVSDFETAFEQILSGVQTGQISEDTIDQAVNRILAVKELIFE